MDDAASPFVGAVVHGLMIVPHIFEPLVAAIIVRIDQASLCNVLADYTFESGHFGIRHNASADVAAALDRAKYDRFPACAGFFVRVRAMKHFVHFNNTGERAGLARMIGRCHQLAQFMRHAPRGFVGATDLPLQFLRRYPMARAGHEVHREKPIGQFRAGLMEDGPGTWINVMAAFLTGVGPPIGHRVKLDGHDTATGASDPRSAELDLHHGF